MIAATSNRLSIPTAHAARPTAWLNLMKPIAIDLFCGLGGWAEGFLAEGYDVIGFDNERHRYPAMVGMPSEGLKVPGNNSAMQWKDRPIARLKDAHRQGQVIEGWHEYPGQLVLQDVLTLHGSQFRNAAVIVASPPCQAYSYRAMPWKRAKALPPPSNDLFEACFRIQREASEAAGRYVPLIVENVRGAEKWVGAARWHFGSYYLWGDVPPLMPIPRRATKVPGFRFDGSGKSFQSASVEAGRKVPGINLTTVGFNVAATQRMRENGTKTEKHLNKRNGHSHTRHLANQREHLERKDRPGYPYSPGDSRKQASAEIAKIPFPLAQHIAQVFKPHE